MQTTAEVARAESARKVARVFGDRGYSIPSELTTIDGVIVEMCRQLGTPEPVVSMIIERGDPHLASLVYIDANSLPDEEQQRIWNFLIGK